MHTKRKGWVYYWFEGHYNEDRGEGEIGEGEGGGGRREGWRGRKKQNEGKIENQRKNTAFAVY